MIAWIFIKKEPRKKKQRVELYGCLEELYDKEKSNFLGLTPFYKAKNKIPSMDMFRKLVKFKFINARFHIEKKTAKRKKHLNPRKKNVKRSKHK